MVPTGQPRALLFGYRVPPSPPFCKMLRIIELARNSCQNIQPKRLRGHIPDNTGLSAGWRGRVSFRFRAARTPCRDNDQIKSGMTARSDVTRRLWKSCLHAVPAGDHVVGIYCQGGSPPADVIPRVGRTARIVSRLGKNNGASPVCPSICRPSICP